jgi:hypothetical protein
MKLVKQQYFPAACFSEYPYLGQYTELSMARTAHFLHCVMPTKKGYLHVETHRQGCSEPCATTIGDPAEGLLVLLFDPTIAQPEQVIWMIDLAFQPINYDRQA